MDPEDVNEARNSSNKDSKTIAREEDGKYISIAIIAVGIFDIPELLDPKDVNKAGNSSNKESDSVPAYATASSQIILEPSPFNDIGAILDPIKSIETVCLAVINLTRDEKQSSHRTT